MNLEGFNCKYNEKDATILYKLMNGFKYFYNNIYILFTIFKML